MPAWKKTPREKLIYSIFATNIGEEVFEEQDLAKIWSIGLWMSFGEVSSIGKGSLCRRVIWKLRTSSPSQMSFTQIITLIRSPQRALATTGCSSTETSGFCQAAASGCSHLVNWQLDYLCIVIWISVIPNPDLTEKCSFLMSWMSCIQFHTSSMSKFSKITYVFQAFFV